MLSQRRMLGHGNYVAARLREGAEQAAVLGRQRWATWISGTRDASRPSEDVFSRPRNKRTSARACRAPRRGRALAGGGFWLCCGRRGLGGYPRDGLLSLFHGPGYVGHQLFQIVLGVFKLRRLCVHFHLPIRRPPQEKGLARSIQGQSEQSLKTLRRESRRVHTSPGRRQANV